MNLKITHSIVQSQQCIFCGARAIKHGFRKNVFNTVQKYQCPKCKKIFSIDRNKRYRYPYQVREFALKLHKEGVSLRKIAETLGHKSRVNVSHITVKNWIKNDKKN